MSFCADTDIELEVGESLLFQLCPDGSGGYSTTLLADRRARADADIKSVLGPDFDVDSLDTSTADVVKYAAVDLTVFYCYERATEFRRQDGRNVEDARYKRAITTLKEIKSGARDMGRETSPKQSYASAGGVVYHKHGNDGY